MTDEPIRRIDIEDLVVGHFDGSLDETQERELATELATSSEAQRYFLSFMRMEGRLHSLGRDGFLREPNAEADNEATLPREVTATQATSVSPIAPNVRLRRRVFAASSLVVCSAVLLILLSGFPWATSVSAESILRRAQTAAAELIDRTYHVVVSDAEAQGAETELTVSVRGGGCFLVRPKDDAFLMGSDGTEYWVTKEAGPVWIANDARSIGPKARRVLPSSWLFGVATSPKEPLLLDMHGVLSLMERRHNVELVDSANPAEHHLRATLKPNRRGTPANAPDRIDLWADARSGVGLRAEVQWSDGRRLRFELLNSEPLSEHLYHYSEHGAGRDVQFLPTRDQSM